MRTTKMIAKAALCAFVALSAFTAPASAHNISLPQAHIKCNNYIQRLVDDPRLPYIAAERRSVRAFAGHNHYVRCTAKYDTAATQNTKFWACEETIDVYLLPEKSDRVGVMFMSHITKHCGRSKLVGPRPA